MAKWKCVHCGNVAVGEKPPEKCAECGAEKDKFREVDDPGLKATDPVPRPAEAAADPAGRSRLVSPGSMDRLATAHDLLTRLLVKHHAHPMTVHVPNGVLPFSFILCLLAAFFGLDTLSRSAFYALVFVAASMPLVLYTGYLDWKNRYGAHMTRLFMGKMISGGIVAAGSLALVVWMVASPAVLTGPGLRGLFLLVHLGVLAAAGVAGHLGGKLVFGKLPGLK